MRFVLLLLLSCGSLFAAPASWYVAREAYGAGNNGTSWANAWTNVDRVVWSSINAGDTLWLSGGSAGSTNTYIGNLSTYNASANAGTSGSKISIRTAKDSSHNGRVKIQGLIYIDKDYYTLDGALSTNWIPSSVLDTYRIATNCNLEVSYTNNNAGDHAINFGSCLGQTVNWVYVSAAATQSLGGGSDCNALQLNGNSGGSKVSGCDIAYNRLGGAWGYGFFALGMASHDWAQVKLHHNLIEAVHDNYIESDGGIDIYKNVMRGWIAPTVGHPDAMQGITDFVRIWDNIIQDQPGTSVYIEPIGVTWVGNILCYNNLFLTTTQAWHDGVTLTGAALNTQWMATNIWFFNNTWYDAVGSTVFVWNAGANATPTCSISNLHFLNNAIQLSNTVTTTVLSFPTNTAYDNDTRGFLYRTADVEVNYNSIFGSTSGQSQGVRYGIHGDYYDAGYSTMSAFTADYSQYSSNNNLTATFVSLLNSDFRPGADLALKGNGTNLIAAITNLAPECGSDLVGTPRPASGAWDIGCYQSDSSLKLWLSFNNWGGGTNMLDDSGFTNNGILYASSTNWPTATNGPLGNAAAFSRGPWTWPGPPAEPAGSVQYIAVTNMYSITNLTNGTVAAWAWYGDNSINTSSIFDTGYYDQEDSWQLGRQFWDSTQFSVWTNQVLYAAAVFPDGSGSGNHLNTTNWNHYCVTWNGTNFIGYFNGAAFSTNGQAGIPSLKIGTPSWLAIGTWKHQNGPDLDPARQQPPNCCWYGGQLDDLRIYNRALSATEVASLYNGGGTSQSQSGSSGGSTNSTSGSAQLGNGTLQLKGTLLLQ